MARIKILPTDICSVDDCDNSVMCRGWCQKHYTRWRSHGDPLKVLANHGTGRTPEERFWSKVALTADNTRCWEWKGTMGEWGYGQMQMGKKLWRAHRLAWFFVYGYDSPLQILHTCPGGDNPACVNPNHLREGTHQDNMNDRQERNPPPQGAKHYKAIFSENQVLMIRARCENGDHKIAVARELGVHRSTIERCVGRETYADV